MATNEFEGTLSQLSIQESGKAGGKIDIYVYQERKNKSFMIQKFEMSETFLVTPLDGEQRSFKVVQKTQLPAEYERYEKIVKSLPVSH